MCVCELSGVSQFFILEPCWYWECPASSMPAAPGRWPGVPGQGPELCCQCVLVPAPNKSSIIKDLSRGSLLRLWLPAAFIRLQWGAHLLWVNCLPFQLMDLYELLFCFQELGLKKRSLCYKEGRGRRCRGPGPRAVMNCGIRPLRKDCWFCF